MWGFEDASWCGGLRTLAGVGDLMTLAGVGGV